LTAGINLNLFSGGSTKAEVLKIKQQGLKLFGQRDKLIDEVKLEVEKYILDLKTAREKITVTKDAVGQAEENLRINRVRYSEGVGTATEVLDAVTLLTIAETNLYKSLYDFRRAEAGLIYSIGKDLSEVYK
jgi:outer membrane protein TolC